MLQQTFAKEGSCLLRMLRLRRRGGIEEQK